MKREEAEKRAKRKVAVVVGGTHGIGEALSDELRSQGYEVLRGGRSKGGVHVDLGEATAMRAFANRVVHALDGRPLDLLVVSAAVWLGRHERTYDGLEATLAVNHFGHAYVVDMLLPELRKSRDPRVVVLTSLAAYGGLPCASAAAWRAELRRDVPFWPNTLPAMFNRYADSKLCNVMFAQTLKERNPWLCVALAHPGSCATRLVVGEYLLDDLIMFLSMYLWKSPRGAAQTPLYLCLADRGELRTDAIYSEMSPMPLPLQCTAAARRALADATDDYIANVQQRDEIQRMTRT